MNPKEFHIDPSHSILGNGKQKYVVQNNISSATLIGQEPLIFPLQNNILIENLIITKWYGRFGNNFFQIAHGLIVADQLGIGKIFMPDTYPREILSPQKCGSKSFNIVYFGRPIESRSSISGQFFVPYGLEHIFSTISNRRLSRLLNELKNSVFRNLTADATVRTKPYVAAHFRGGDVFTDTDAPGYVQPPASYYIAAIEHALNNTNINTVDLVCEDRANPAVELVERHLKSIKVEFRSASNSLFMDMRRLIHAQCIVSSASTMPEAAILLSNNIRRVYGFRNHSSQHGYRPFLQTKIQDIMNVRKIKSFIIDDAFSAYPVQGTWKNTLINRKLIEEYSVENLRIFETSATRQKISSLCDIFK